MDDKNWNSSLSKIDEIEGYLVPGQEKALAILASSLKSSSTIVEIGSYLGRSTACLAFGSPASSRIYAIDTFEGNKKDFLEGRDFKGRNFFARFKNNLKKVGLLSKVKPLKGFSGQIGKTWNKPIDLLFIDGSHFYDDVKKDFELFFPWIKPGGIIALHDVTPKIPGVYRAWNQIVKNRLSAWGNVANLYFGYKPTSIFSKQIGHIKIKSLLNKMQ